MTTGYPGSAHVDLRSRASNMPELHLNTETSMDMDMDMDMNVDVDGDVNMGWDGTAGNGGCRHVSAELLSAVVLC
ncbi:hypothetical protein LA080_010756 [Diaporthe eres]|nr:hypothetical protein LA080_010756 [Diaporthe eres]